MCTVLHDIYMTTQQTVPAKQLPHDAILSAGISTSYEIARGIWMSEQTGEMSFEGVTVALRLSAVRVSGVCPGTVTI